MRRSRNLIIAVAAAVILGGGGLIVLGLTDDDDGVLPAAIGGNAKPAGPSAEELAKRERAKRAKALDAALKQVAAETPDFSVAVLDKKTGQTYAYQGAETFDTASIVKAQILACELLKAQDADREPTEGEMALATPMIRASDNNATTELFQHLGGKSAITKCNKRLGLSQTTVNKAWGLTRTTASDQVRLLSKLVDTKGPLDEESRKTAFTLMNTVNDDQNWGVPAVAQPGETATVKNGWDTRSADGGLWAVNTIGRVTSPEGDVNVSLAVLSHNNQSMDTGIALVEKVAKLTRTHLKY
ncbi:class A beta-lactamase-related serine hydrolase [Actinoplanes sp. TRM 88003]|uniref:Class A beta-lactamase-related serine hydrolase n=1 Tax=Paractinoplanes aksuensis TaxID=2939490 RepID=A0ABT1DW30_9ACTN|nr:serine hydrolase [Actinoplanes aksuensis]MCO8274980.1 class A beta-lactamase-related serine hydrolase [Actinoplanes aksuensis]